MKFQGCELVKMTRVLWWWIEGETSNGVAVGVGRLEASVISGYGGEGNGGG